MNDAQRHITAGDTHLFTFLWSRVFLTALMLFLPSVDALSQVSGNGIRVALRTGIPLSGGFSSDSLSIYPLSPGCGTYQSNAIRPGWMGGIEVLFPDHIHFPVPDFIGLGFGLDQGRMVGDPVDAQRTIDPATNSPVDIDREYRIDWKQMSLSIAGGYLWRPTERMTIPIRVGGLLKLGSTILYSDNIVGPSGIRFENGETVREIAGAEVYDLSNVDVTIGTGLRYRLDVSRYLGIELGPEFNLGLIPSIAGSSRRTWQTILSVGLVYDTYREPPPSFPEPPLPMAPPTPRLQPVTAEVNIVGVEPDGTEREISTIAATEVDETRTIPVLNAIFFNPGEEEPAIRYMEAFDSAGLTYRSPNITSEQSIVAANREILPIVAQRLNVESNLHLQLSAAPIDDEAESLVQARLENVKGRLVAQGISPERIETRLLIPLQQPEQPDRLEELRKVTLMTGSDRALSPEVVHQRVTEFSPPNISVQPNYSSTYGLQSWELVVTSNGRELVRYSSDDERAGRPMDFNWSIHGPESIDDSIPPVVARFTVVDSLGQTATATDTIPVILTSYRTEQDRDVALIRGATTIRRGISWLINFDYDNAAFPESRRSELQSIAGSIQNGDYVKIVGYTDRIGAETYNRELSEKRAEAVRIQLMELLNRKGIRNISIETFGAGVDRVNFENDTPEGRLLSRSVQIVVERELP